MCRWCTLMPFPVPPPDRSPTLQVNIKNLIADVQCYKTGRELRWPEGIKCPSWASTQVIKHGFDDTECARQHYGCTACHTRFDDLTATIFAEHHQPLKWSMSHLLSIWTLTRVGVMLTLVLGTLLSGCRTPPDMRP